MHNDHITDN